MREMEGRYYDALEKLNKTKPAEAIFDNNIFDDALLKIGYVKDKQRRVFTKLTNTTYIKNILIEVRQSKAEDICKDTPGCYGITVYITTEFRGRMYNVREHIDIDPGWSDKTKKDNLFEVLGNAVCRFIDKLEDKE